MGKVQIVIDMDEYDYDYLIRHRNYKLISHSEKLILQGKVFSKENYIPVAWLKEKLTNHPEIPYSITDGIINVLELWEENKDADSN